MTFAGVPDPTANFSHFTEELFIALVKYTSNKNRELILI